jgi:hypothetical protein
MLVYVTYFDHCCNMRIDVIIMLRKNTPNYLGVVVLSNNPWSAMADNILKDRRGRYYPNIPLYSLIVFVVFDMKIYVPYTRVLLSVPDPKFFFATVYRGYFKNIIKIGSLRK